MNLKKVIMVAGFDPSAGAGILSDIKVCNHFSVYGFGIMSALTIQNETALTELVWVHKSMIEKQIQIILSRHAIDAIKIGVIENMEILDLIISAAKKQNQGVQIIWDPILVSSGGYTFMEKVDKTEVERLAMQCALVTPNIAEFRSIWGDHSSLTDLPRPLTVLLKSSESDEEFVFDELYRGGTVRKFRHNRLHGFDKHGSGCILSTGITSCLARGLGLTASYRLANQFLTSYMRSSKSLLGTMS